jgi:hypothetical protein
VGDWVALLHVNCIAPLSVQRPTGDGCFVALVLAHELQLLLCARRGGKRGPAGDQLLPAFLITVLLHSAQQLFVTAQHAVLQVYAAAGAHR